MGKLQVCRICRSEKNLKYSAKELKQLNKKQLLLAHATQGQENNRGSKKLLLTTPTLGNICQVCDERIQIFHRLDDCSHDGCSDIEIDVVNSTNNTLPLGFDDSIPKENFIQRQQRPETPVIVDDNDMLYNIFMEKINQQRQFRTQHQTDATVVEQPAQQFVNQFHTSYTPPQSSAGSSEGEESKVIEILTSRESTPASVVPSLSTQSQSGVIDQQGHRIVAIIELDDGEENEQRNTEVNENISGVLTPVTNCSNDLCFGDNNDNRSRILSSPIETSNNQNSYSQNCNQQLDDDEEIIFRKVDPEKESSATVKKRKRKSYDEKQLRLVASLSLVSSDSETEENPSEKVLPDQAKVLNTNSTESIPTVVQQFVTCDFCNIKLPDSQSLSVHEIIHKGIKCTLCQVGFAQVKRLIHHMRCKHRAYNGYVLSEKPRSGQDSCMTIRLRYMQRNTFYECQLCGRIDDVLKEHKDHIIEKHANESKSLKDPIMKQLKCPVCKLKCGAQYLSLCRHLIASHEYQEYKSHLRELIHVSAFGWNIIRQQEVAKTAKIYQFSKRKTLFFECKICHKIVAGYLHHLRHANKHQSSEGISANVISTSKTSESSKEELKKSNIIPTKIITKTTTKPKLNTKSKKMQKIKEKSKQLIKTIEKSVKKPKAILKPNKTKKLKHHKIEKSKKSTLLGKPKETQTKSSETKTKIQIKIKLKPKDNNMKNKHSEEKLTKVKPKKESSCKAKDTEKSKLKGKSKEIVHKPQVIKVKVKPPIRQIDLQKFKCRYCLKKFKGFRIFNLHLLQQHQDNEYTKCVTCNKIFRNPFTLEEHYKQNPHISLLSKRKCKISENCSMSKNCSERYKKVPNICNNTCNSENNYRWLQDLLKLSQSSKISDSNSAALCINNNNNNNSNISNNNIILKSNFQCCYCLHLFADENNLNEHIKKQHSQKEDIFIKYKPLNIVNT